MAIALSGTISEDDKKKKQQINEYCNYIITNHNIEEDYYNNCNTNTSILYNF